MTASFIKLGIILFFVAAFGTIIYAIYRHEKLKKSFPLELDKTIQQEHQNIKYTYHYSQPNRIINKYAVPKLTITIKGNFKGEVLIEKNLNLLSADPSKVPFEERYSIKVTPENLKSKIFEPEMQKILLEIFDELSFRPSTLSIQNQELSILFKNVTVETKDFSFMQKGVELLHALDQKI